MEKYDKLEDVGKGKQNAFFRLISNRKFWLSEQDQA